MRLKMRQRALGRREATMGLKRGSLFPMAAV